jgi:signal peptidase complex subunit 3
VAEEEDVVLRLHYNVQPWVGLLTWNQDADFWKWKPLSNNLSKKFALPPIKKKKEEKKAGV